MKKFFAAILFFIFLFQGCSSLSKNYVKNGSFVLNSGTFSSQRWPSDLEFKRISWYQELTLSFDLIYTKIDQTSPFYQWFSKSEKDLISSCTEFYVSFSYSLDPGKIPQKAYIEQMADYGFSKMVLPTFSSFISNHPDFEKNSLKMYKILGFCRKDAPRRDLNIQFPNFLSQKI